MSERQKKPMGRPRILDDGKQVNVRMSADTRAALTAAAEQAGVTKSVMARQLLDEGLRRRAARAKKTT